MSSKKLALASFSSGVVVPDPISIIHSPQLRFNMDTRGFEYKFFLFILLLTFNIYDLKM